MHRHTPGPWRVFRLSYRCTNHRNLYVRGHIDTPLELAIENEIDRFSLAIDASDRVQALRKRGPHVKEMPRDRSIVCVSYAHQHGIDPPEPADWQWPF